MASYPNLELLEYKFQVTLSSDPKWRKKYQKLKEEGNYIRAEFEVEVFSQMWGSTNTAFDVDAYGNSVIGGCAMTKAYTTVIKELVTETYGVYVDGRLCYIVSDATEEFYKDLEDRNMTFVSKAKTRY